MRVRSSFLIISLALAAIILGSFIGTHFFGGEPAATLQDNSLAAVLAMQNKTLKLGARTKETNCKASGPLPDRECTPGAVFPNMSPAEICVKGYTKTVRSVSVSLKRKVYAEYGIPYPPPTGAYEADHLIPLELGGSNDIANLFPEAASTTPGFREKDLVENFLHDEVCAGRADLNAAQIQIASNWVQVWNMLTPEQIQYLKNQF